MNGIENITARIDADAQAEVQDILTQADARVQTIAGEWAAQARQEADAILAAGQTAAGERRERLESAAQLEGKKLLLEARQEMLGKAFDQALEKLLSLPEEKYVELLAGLCVKAAVTGREQVIFSPRDQKKAGAKAVAKANERLKEGKLTVAEETRPIRGGFILSDAGVEVNCAFDTLVRLSRPRLERQAAQILFDA